MKYTLSISDCTKEEITNVLAKLEGGTKVAVASETKVKEEVAIDTSDLNSLKVADLKALCDERALKYVGRSTKKDLIDLLEGRVASAPAEVEAPVVEAAPVIQPEVVVPAASTTAINEAPAQVQAAAPVADQGALIATFTDTYTKTINAGIPEAQLQSNIGAHLQNLGHPGVRLSQLPVHILEQFLGLFRAECGNLLQPQAAAPAGNNSFI
ncbi:MAG: hypothetical protein Unbinned1322contig1000_32 [Prokaryotic dsDNA virus sp.]|nr:hypothetical protein [Aequorivita sp.]QDP57288.1 MAG: hypothetical protein Unbinned1322contig1000_32 [Prokaryotic dsDNA virus sp.]|tara:strand:+ start:14154 stop:14786 length:633 start_codon:yes stop_codon:yes gene_type:complete